MAKSIHFEWEYAEKLDPVFTSNSRYIVLEGGRSSSKSHFLGRKFLEDRLHQKRDLLCVRQYQNDLEQSNYKLFTQLIEQYKLPYKVTQGKITSLLTGAQIIFVGMNHVTQDNIKSYEGFHDAWIEEAQNFSIESFELLDPTIRQDGSRIYASMNRKVLKGDIIEHIEHTFPENHLRIHIDYLDNPHCPQDMIELAESYKQNKPDEYEEVWLGLPRAYDDTKVVKYWAKDNIRKVKYSPKHTMHLSCDFNLSPNCWILAHKTDRRAYFFDEFCLDLSTEELIKVVLDKYPHPGQIIINGDASGDFGSSNSKATDYTLIKNELIRRGYRHGDGVKSYKFELRAANGNRLSRFASWNAKVLDLNGHRCIYADPKCKWLIYNCEELTIIPGTSKFSEPSTARIKNDNKLKYLGHAYDNACYLVNTYWGIKSSKVAHKEELRKTLVQQFKESD